MKHPGAFFTEDRNCEFTVWAPGKQEMILHLAAPEERKFKMIKDQDGYFSLTLKNLSKDTLYFYQPEGKGDYPDPASFFQPDGVHGPSALVNHSDFQWTDALWKNIPPNDLVIYEIHVGTFTPEGTFEAIIPRLKELAWLGVNAIEVMPVAQFPGARNWGYDGVFPYAVQNSYGGPEGLKKLVNACHQHGIAVLLDVVYNHLGPEGNYLSRFAPYFSSAYHTPWGDAVNFDREWSDGVKGYFVYNMLYWLEYFHIDGLRLDAIHTMFDSGAYNIWQMIQEHKKALEAKTGRTYTLIAESDLNDPKVIKPASEGGMGFEVQWLDDFHHALFVMLYPPGKKRYEDFGSIYQLAKAYKDGFVHSGEYVRFRKRRHGISSAGISGEKFVVFNQNHDQIGNRPLGERLSVLVDFQRLKLAAAALLLSPYIPMLFMGEEYGEKAPFYYFVSHSDPKLIEAVREGRKKEFAALKDENTPPEAQDEATFQKSKLNWEIRETGEHQLLWHWHRKLIELRHTNPVLKNKDKNNVAAYPNGTHGLILFRQSPDGRRHVAAFLNFSEDPIHFILPALGSNWKMILDSGQQQWCAGMEPSPAPEFLKEKDDFLLSPFQAVVYEAF